MVFNGISIYARQFIETSLENATETRRFGAINIKTKSIRIKSLSKVYEPS